MGLPFGVKLLLVLAATLVAIIVGMVGAILAHLDGAGLPACVTRGGVALAGAMTLLVLLLSSLGALT